MKATRLRLPLPTPARARVAVTQEPRPLAACHPRRLRQVAPVPTALPVKVVVAEQIQPDDAIHAAHAVAADIHRMSCIPTTHVLDVATSAAVRVADVVTPQVIGVHGVVLLEPRAQPRCPIHILVDVMIRREQVDHHLYVVPLADHGRANPPTCRARR